MTQEVRDMFIKALGMCELSQAMYEEDKAENPESLENPDPSAAMYRVYEKAEACLAEALGEWEQDPNFYEDMDKLVGKTSDEALFAVDFAISDQNKHCAILVVKDGEKHLWSTLPEDDFKPLLEEHLQIPEFVEAVKNSKEGYNIMLRGWTIPMSDAIFDGRLVREQDVEVSPDLSVKWGEKRYRQIAMPKKD
jgi:hypothetical protein